MAGCCFPFQYPAPLNPAQQRPTTSRMVDDRRTSTPTSLGRVNLLALTVTELFAWALLCVQRCCNVVGARQTQTARATQLHLDVGTTVVLVDFCGAYLMCANGIMHHLQARILPFVGIPPRNASFLSNLAVAANGWLQRMRLL